MKNASFLKKNGLSTSLLGLFLAFWAGQALTGWKVYNEELLEDKGNPIPFFDYLSSGHFVSATFENWESEFLQMFIFVVFSIFLYQQGSAESKSMNKKEDVDEAPDERMSPHWMIRQGGLMKWLYANSLSITLFVFFTFSFFAHSWGSFRHHQTQQLIKNKNPDSYSEYIISTDFWFESFQNWQSEFLAVFVIVYFTVFLRQQGSLQSKKVDATDDENE